MGDSKLEIRLKTKNKGGRPKGSRTIQPDVELKPSKRMADLMRACYDDATWLEIQATIHKRAIPAAWNCRAEGEGRAER